MNIDYVKNGYIPNFLFEIWKEKHGGDPVVDFERERDEMRVNSSKIFPLFLGMLISTLFILTMYTFNSEEPPPLRGLVVVIVATVIVMSIIIILIRYFSCRKNNPVNGNGHNCYKAVENLFREFDIEPSEGIGKLSKEEFRALIEDELQEQGLAVAQTKGFKSLDQREKFNGMHKAALKWGLCHPTWDGYFPKQSVES